MNPFDQFDAAPAQTQAVSTPATAANPFDRFDAAPASSAAPTQAAANPFDQFDPVVAPAAGAHAEQPQVPGSAVAGGFAHRLGLGVRDVVEGVAGPAYNAAGAAFRAAGVPVRTLGENLDALGLPQAQTPGEHMVSSVIQPIAGIMTGYGVGGALARAASPIVQAMGQMLQSQPAMQAVSAGVGGAAQEATGSPLMGMAAGMLAPAAAGGLGRAISPNIVAGLSPSRQAAVALADREGIPLSVAQITGGKVAKNFESSLGNLPGSSGVQAAANDAQNAAFNSAAMGRVGSVADNALPGTLNAERARIGGDIGNIANRNTFRQDPQFLNDLHDFTTELNTLGTTPAQQAVNPHIQAFVDKLGDPGIGAVGELPGQAFQQAQSKIGQMAASSSDGYTRDYLGRLQRIMRDGMERNISPQDQADWQQARGQYANLQTIAKAMDNGGPAAMAGDIAPGRLLTAAGNKTTKATAFGQGRMADLARMGQTLMAQTVPDSGTAQRTAMANMLQGKTAVPAMMGTVATGNPLAMLAPVAEVGLPYAAAKLYHSNAFNNYMRNSLTSGITPQMNGLTALGIGAQAGANQLRDR